MRVIPTAFYMLLSILGLSVISLGGMIGVQLFRGKLQPGDLHGMMRVIGGASRIMISNRDYEEFQAFARDKEKARAELEANRGLPVSREPPALRADEARTALRDEVETLNRFLDDQKGTIERLRSEVETRKRQVEALGSALDDEKKKKAIMEGDAATAKLRKTLSEMDAGDIALFLTSVVRDPSLGGPPEAARIVREHLKADFSAEVLGEMEQAERERVLPLLENRYAGVPPAAVAKSFADEKVGPGEQLVHMLHMTAQQALGVYLRLPQEAQEKIASEVLRQ